MNLINKIRAKAFDAQLAVIGKLEEAKTLLADNRGVKETAAAASHTALEVVAAVIFGGLVIVFISVTFFPELTGKIMSIFDF